MKTAYAEIVRKQMTKYYRVKEDNFLWKKGAILKKEEDENGYAPISDLWDTTEVNGTEYITAKIVEAPENAKYFERVYEMSKGKQAVYLVKEKAQETASKFFAGE